MMPPAYNHPSEAALDRVLRLSDELRRASDTVSRLTSGASTVAIAHLGVGGRLGHKAIVTRRWSGPHRDTFETLFNLEVEAARVADRELAEEAEAWRRFWTIAVAARHDAETGSIIGANANRLHSPDTRTAE